MRASAKRALGRQIALIGAICLPVAACGSSEVSQRAVSQENEPVVGEHGPRCHPHSKARRCHLDAGVDAGEDSGIEDAGMEAGDDSSLDAAGDAGNDGGNGCLVAGTVPLSFAGVRCATTASDTTGCTAMTTAYEMAGSVTIAFSGASGWTATLTSGVPASISPFPLTPSGNGYRGTGSGTVGCQSCVCAVSVTIDCQAATLTESAGCITQTGNGCPQGGTQCGQNGTIVSSPGGGIFASFGQMAVIPY